MRRLRRTIPLTIILLLLSTLIGPAVSLAYDSNIDLKTADSFAVLAGSEITNTGTTIIDGDVGLYAGSAFTGQDTAIISGEVHIGDAVAIEAKTDLETAYNDAVSRDENIFDSELGGKTLTSGVYSSETSFQITGTLTLDGENDPDSVFIFQAGSTLTTGAYSRVELINGASCDNVFWQVGSSATLGTNSTFLGSILAYTSITANTGAEIQGRLLAMNGAVTLDNNTIYQCSATTGALTVTKEVSGDTDDLTLPTFEITVTGPEEFTETRTFAANESHTWFDLVPGEYIVTENYSDLSDEWTVEGEGAVIVSAGNHLAATITNVYTKASVPTPTTGSLTVTKIVSGDIDDLTLPTFEITVTGPEGFTETRTFTDGESYKWEGLVPGEFTVTENRTGLSEEWTVSGEGMVVVSADENQTATITNSFTASSDPTPTDPSPTDPSPTDPSPTDPTPTDPSPTDSSSIETTPEDSARGSLALEITVTGDIGDITLPTFETTVTGPEGFTATRTFANNESYTWDGLIPGEYIITVNRSDLNSGWTVSGEGTVQVAANEGETVTINYHYEAMEAIPQTGQASNYGLTIILIIASAIFAGTGTILAIKRKKLYA